MNYNSNLSDNLRLNNHVTVDGTICQSGTTASTDCRLFEENIEK